MPFLTDTLAAANHNTILTIPSLHDIKEDMWSSTYSLKGKPFKLLLLRNHQQVVKQGPLLTIHTMPFKIKTGGSS